MPVTTTEDNHWHVCDNYRGQSLQCLWQLQRTVTRGRACGDCDTLMTHLSSPGDAWSNMKDGGEGQFPTIPLRCKTNHVQHLGPDYLMLIKVRKWFSFKMKKWIMFIFARLNLYGCCTTDQWASCFSWNKLYVHLLGLVWSISDLTMAWKSK